jgi:hypothetical protein
VMHQEGWIELMAKGRTSFQTMVRGQTAAQRRGQRAGLGAATMIGSLERRIGSLVTRISRVVPQSLCVAQVASSRLPLLRRQAG